jgi:AGCS family alanine or glycine:cation symporter
MISWAYYGERAWVYLFGSKFSIIYKLMFLSLSVIATQVNTGIMVDFSFMLMLAMALPNIFGLFVLGGGVKEQLDDYLKKLKSGELDKEAIR